MDLHRKRLVKGDMFQKRVNEILIKNYEQVVILISEAGDLEFAALDHIFNSIYISFIDFFDMNEVVSVFLEMDSGRLSYLCEQKYETLEKLEEHYKKRGATFKLCEQFEHKGFRVKGHKAACKQFIIRYDCMYSLQTF